MVIAGVLSLTNVDSFRINNGGPGTIGAWAANTPNAAFPTSSPNMPARAKFASVAYNGYLYVMGGHQVLQAVIVLVQVTIVTVLSMPQSIAMVTSALGPPRQHFPVAVPICQLEKDSLQLSTTVTYTLWGVCPVVLLGTVRQPAMYVTVSSTPQLTVTVPSVPGPLPLTFSASSPTMPPAII